MVRKLEMDQRIEMDRKIEMDRSLARVHSSEMDMNLAMAKSSQKDSIPEINVQLVQLILNNFQTKSV